MTALSPFGKRRAARVETARITIPIAAVVAMVGVLSAQSRPLTDKDVDALIVAGRANKFGKFVKTCTATRTSGGTFGGGLLGDAIAAGVNAGRNYTVVLMSGRGKIATAAWDATQAGRAFTLADVLEDQRRPVLYVQVTPKLPTDPDADAVIPSPIKDLFFKSRGSLRVETLKPTGELRSLASTWKNAKGATVEYSQIVAQFDVDRAASLPLEDYRDSPDFVVLTEAGERSCPVSLDTLRGFAKDR